MLTGLHHVQVACPAGSEDALRAFYAGVLGMTEVAKPPVLTARGGAWFRSGGAEIHCGVEADFRPARKAHPGLLTADLDTLAAACEAAGHPVEWDPHFPGHRRLYVADPVGNRLELLEPLGDG
jgi:catechol 2,3-dioxygenase-like lactoylglutathione lyase family enzyme